MWNFRPRGEGEDEPGSLEDFDIGFIIFLVILIMVGVSVYIYCRVIKPRREAAKKEAEIEAVKEAK